MRKDRPGQPRKPGSQPIKRPDSRFADRQPGRAADGQRDRKPGFKGHNRPRRPMKIVEEPALSETMRIAKAMARAGLCSRRDAERWILEGRVAVNGSIITSPALDVGPTDTIKVDGQPLTKPEPAMLWRFHKPRGCVTTHRDPEGRPTVFEKLPKDMPRVISIGRLDFNTEGLLLLTTDGDLARHFELPATGWLRRYRVRANGLVTQEQLDALRDGVEIEGVKYGPIEGTVDRVQGANVWLTLGLREGKNREVRKILGSLGLDVNRLIRISFGPFQLLDLEEGAVDRVKRRVLADQLGPELTQQFGLDILQVEERATKNTGYQARRPVPDADTTEKKAGSQPLPKHPTSKGQTRKKPFQKKVLETAAVDPPRRERPAPAPRGFQLKTDRNKPGPPTGPPVGPQPRAEQTPARTDRSASKPRSIRSGDFKRRPQR